jgi:hypothetical protein
MFLMIIIIIIFLDYLHTNLTAHRPSTHDDDDGDINETSCVMLTCAIMTSISLKATTPAATK